MTRLIYITHPDVIQDPTVPVPEWPLSPRGRLRMAVLLSVDWITSITHVTSSTERKALDGAAILANHLNLPSNAVAELGEIDRSSTGFLPNDEHATAARACFEVPDVSVRGWETARDAQTRVARAVRSILANLRDEDVVAMVGHGGVGTLLLCYLTGRPIGLNERPPGADGGYYFIYDEGQGELIQGWERIDNPPIAETSN